MAVQSPNAIDRILGKRLFSNGTTKLWGTKMKVTYTNKKGEKVEQKFDTEEEGKKLKEKLKAQGVTDAKWEW